METKNIDIVKLLREYNQNPENKSLKSLYSGRTIFDIIGKGRNETAHSAFLEWLFSGRDISGTSTENTLIGLLDAVMRRIDEQDKDWRQDDKIVAISNALLSRTLKITNIKSETEKPIIGNYCTKGEKDSIDIFISCDVRGIDKICRFEFIIENKIGSKEGGPKDEQSSIDYDKMWQTERYYKACSKDTDDTYQFFIYLSAATDTEMASGNKQCKSEHFICLNYQDIYDDILAQLLESSKLANREKYLIREYVKVLSIPMASRLEDNADYDSKNDSVNKSIILATSKEEKQLLKAYWYNNQMLIIASLQAYEDTDDGSLIKHDWTRFVDNKGNLYTKIEYIQKTFEIYKKQWEIPAFKSSELINLYISEFNKKFSRQKSGPYLELKQTEKQRIEVCEYKPGGVDQALKALNSSCNNLSNDEKKRNILQIFFCEHEKISAEEAFNRKIKFNISNCQDFIVNGEVKSSKLLNEICDQCCNNAEQIDQTLLVKKIEYDNDKFQQVLVDFWNVNKSLIMASARVLTDSNDLPQATQTAIKDVYEGISKRDWTTYRVSLNSSKTITASALGVFKWYVQTLIWTGQQGRSQISKANTTLNELLKVRDILKTDKGKKGNWSEVKKPDWANGEPTSYFLNISKYKNLFDNILYEYLDNNTDGYTIEKLH